MNENVLHVLPPKVRPHDLDRLRKGMVENYIAVNPERNPVAVSQELTGRHRRYVLGQYVIALPRYIIELLSSAKNSARTVGMAAVVADLEKNIGQEKGSESYGISHYEILRRGVEKNINSNFFKGITPSPNTLRFISGVKKAVSNKDAAYAIGAAYALEASAVPELLIVRKLITDLLGHPIEEEGLKGFFDRHIEGWEVQHEDGLRNAVVKSLGEEDLPLFGSGFDSVMKAEDEWWRRVYEEALKNN